MGLTFKIQYKQGQFNKVADALSRKPSGPHTVTAELLAISACKPVWLETIVHKYLEDPHTKNLLTTLSAPGGTHLDFALQDGVLRFKGRLWVSYNSEIQQHIISALHDSAVGGHSGFFATYHRIKRLFAWHNMKAHIKAFVQSCATCQQAKVERVAPPGLLQPLSILDQAWSIVSLDFIEGLPKSARQDTILVVVVDKLSKYAHFLPLKHPFTALTVSKLYMHNIYKLHGLPRTIISDHDRVFTSTLWQELFRLTETQLRMSSSYHPQTDG